VILRDVRHALAADGAAGIVSIDERQIIGGDGDGEPGALGPESSLAFVLGELEMFVELGDARD
jgi:hypothetical protein